MSIKIISKINLVLNWILLLSILSIAFKYDNYDIFKLLKNIFTSGDYNFIYYISPVLGLVLATIFNKRVGSRKTAGTWSMFAISTTISVLGIAAFFMVIFNAFILRDGTAFWIWQIGVLYIGGIAIVVGIITLAIVKLARRKKA